MKRTSIYVEGFTHAGQPVPAATRIGNTVATGGIWGFDIATGRTPPEPDRQCQFMFANLARVLAAAGLSLDDILRLRIYVAPDVDKESLNRRWVDAFPDRNSRPARHVVVNEHLREGALMVCEALAICD
ncbi:MAG: RidA family protein [Alphaproteobacteria bacterium]|nr:RidA family protein [Alphaproteobacteria bacterium]